MLSILKKIIPESVVKLFRSPYHYLLQLYAAVVCGFPARKMIVVGITGTKGKSTSADMMYAVFKAAGYKTALASTIRFVTPNGEEANKFKMTMQGRGFIQYFLARAQKEGATHAVVEITSEGTRQYRHLFLSLDALIVTNIQKEHIESHGGFENYVAAKRLIVGELEHSDKANRALVCNTDYPETKKFLDDANVPTKIGFGISELQTAPVVPLDGEFNRMNALAVLKVAMHLGIPEDIARKALAELPPVKGRVEHISIGPEQTFAAIVDYAHTPDSLKALYGAFPNQKKICVLGNTGGGRDTWKRSEMGAIADQECSAVILTNEDPYDEDPKAIVDAMAKGMKRPPTIIMDRREAIRTALSEAKSGDVVLISGKGTDPYIMEAKGKKTPWSDAIVVREELQKLFKK
jgi:UDP-N-acetylmuramoyl-L-alanyl-D-glutamate--2,6-diaminopimelate ligase